MLLIIQENVAVLFTNRIIFTQQTIKILSVLLATETSREII